MNTETFAKRFTAGEWFELCALANFNAAVMAGEWESAEVIAHEHLTRRWDDEIHRAAAGVAGWEARHQAARELVHQWAEATGRTGREHKQVRQSRIRRIVKHGLASEYARKIRAEAGMISE